MDSSSENMDSSGEEYGTLLFFRKDGAHSLPYPLSEGENTVGSSSDADVRLKINDDCLEKIHCVIDVNENGIATIINKSAKAPIKVNGIPIRKYTVLIDKDFIDIVGKKCQYLNAYVSLEEVKKNEETLAKKGLISSSSRRRTVAPQVQGRSAAKQSPNLRTRTPVQVQTMFLKRKSEGAGVEHTPEKRLDQRTLSEKSKTTSKLVVSKALGAKHIKRRLSLGSGPRKPNNNINARVSARNIQVNKNTITAMITEDEERPSLSMKRISTPVNKKLESVKPSSRRSIKKSLMSDNDMISFDSPRKSILKNTPRKSVLTVDNNATDLLTKTVSFSNAKAHENSKEDIKYLRNPGNSSGILYSDETERLRLSSSSTLSPVGSYPSQESLVFSSDTESLNKPISRLSLRKSMEHQIEMPASRKSRLSLAKTSINMVENARNSINASKTRISSRNSINIPKDTTGSSENKFTPDEVNKTDFSDESINLHLSASSSSSEPHSTRDIEDVSETPPNQTLKQRNSVLGTVSTDELCTISSRGVNSQDSENSSSNSSPERDIATQSCDDTEKGDSVIDEINTRYEISKRKSSLRKTDTLKDSLEEDISLADEPPLSPIHPLPRRASIRNSNLEITSQTTGYNLQASARKSSNKSIEQDEENESLNFSEDRQCSKSELETSFEGSRSDQGPLISEELPSLPSRRSSVRRSHTVEPLVSNRRSSLPSQGSRVSETTRVSSRKSRTSLVDNVDEPEAKGRKSSVLASPSGARTPQLDIDTSYSDNDKSFSCSEKNRSIRNSRSFSTSCIQNASVLSLDNEIPETSRRPLRNSSRKSLVENLGNNAHTSFAKSSLDDSQENLTPELKISYLKTPQPNRKSPMKHRMSSDIQENLTSLLGNASELEDKSIKNMNFSLGRHDLTLPLVVTTPVPRSRSSVRGRKSLVGNIEGELTVDKEISNPENGSSRKSRKPSLGNLQQDKTLPLEDKTPVARNRSSVKSRKSHVDDLQEDLTVPMEYELPGSGTKSFRKYSTNDLHENSTLPLEDETPDRKIESSRKSRKSSLGALQEDSVILLEGQSPVPKNRSSVKSRKSSVNDLQEESTLLMEDDTPNSKIESSGGSSRKSSLGALQQDSVSPVPRNRSSVRSRKSSVGDLHEDSTLPMEDKTPISKIESSRKTRKSSHGHSPVPRNRSSVASRKSLVNDIYENSTLPVEYEASDSEEESFKKSSKSALGSPHHNSTLLLERQTPVPRNRSSIKVRKYSVNELEDSTLPLEGQIPIPRNRSSVKYRKSSVNVLHDNSTLPLEIQQDLDVTSDNKTPELSRSSIHIKNSPVDHFSEGASQPLGGGTPQPIRRSSRTPKPSLRYSVRQPNQSLANQSDASVVCLETSRSSKSGPFSVSDYEESLVAQTPEKSALERSQISSVGRLSPIGDPPPNSSVNAKTPVPYRRSVRRSSKLEESYTISVAHSTLHEGHTLYEGFSVETPESSRRSSARRYKFEDTIDSDTLDATQEPSESQTLGTGIRSSQRANKSTEDLYSDQLGLSMRSETPEINQVYSVRSSATKKDLSVADNLDGTPENNTSIVFIDVETPLEETRKPGHSRLSKTIHSKLEEVDLTTPKSAIKSRRRKSLPYRPETEDITPVSPLDQNERETGFKTPLTTPGVFEDIRKSVLKSRSRIQKSSSSFMEELNKAKSDKKASKRPRESNGDSGRQHKRRKLVINEDDSFESYDGSFESFQSDEALTDISASNLSQDTPSHFSDLTDKPVINHPRTRFSTGDKSKKRLSTRRSLPASTMMLNTSVSNTDDEENSENRSNESSEEVKWAQESPKYNLTEIAGVKRLVRTTKVQNSPKNDLSDVKGVKKLLATPKVTKSPKNELVDLAGVKKLLATPRALKSPKNDLTNIIGVKKLLATPKEMKSPKNDLTNIPNLRRIMSPKYQNSPVNDLSDLRGVKKLLGTPKESKDPLNELSDLEGVAEIFNISGVHRLSTNSDIENEDMFGQLIVRRPLKTYRGKSLSPNKAIDSYGAKRKTMGDKSVISPRVEDWIKEQAIIRIERLDNLGAGDGMNKSDLEKDVEEQSTQNKKKTRVQEIREELDLASPPRRGGRRRAAAGQESDSSRVTTRTQNKVGASTPTDSPLRKATRGKSKKLVEESDVQDESKETKFAKEVESLAASEGMEENAVESPRTTRGRRKAVILAEKPTRGRRKVANQIESSEETDQVEKPIVAKTARGKNKNVEEEKSEDLSAPSVESPKTTRGRRKVKESSVVDKKLRGATIILVEETSEENNAAENVSEDIPKAAKGRRKVIMEENLSNEVVVVSTESAPISRGRRKVAVKNYCEGKMEEGDTGKHVSEHIPKAVRGKSKVVVDEEQSNKAIVASVESPSTTTRARRKVTAKMPVEEKVTKGSKNTAEEPEDTLETSKEIVVFLDSPKIPRGRRNAKVIEEVIVKKPARGKRKVGVKARAVEDNSEDAVSESSKSADRDAAHENELLPVEEADTNEVSKKNTRGTKKIQKLKDVIVESPKPTRGRRKVIDVVESTVDESEESMKKTRSGRNLRTDHVEDSEELLVSRTDIKKPTSKSGKSAKTEEISSDQVDSTTGDFYPILSEVSEEENVLKPVKGRKTRKNLDVEADMKLEEKPESKRKRGGRKVSSDEALNAMEIRTDTEEVEENKIPKPKSKKVTTKKDPVEVSANSRPTRAGRRKGNEDESSVTAKKQTRGKKQSDEDLEQVKVTRGRRRKESEDITEEPPNKITKKNEDSKEKIEEASSGNTRKAGRLAKNKAVAKITEEEVSSPKTRAVKGNFNKYGSSFETESPGKAVGRRKRVHFD